MPKRLQLSLLCYEEHRDTELELSASSRKVFPLATLRLGNQPCSQSDLIDPVEQFECNFAESSASNREVLMRLKAR